MPICVLRCPGSSVAGLQHVRCAVTTLVRRKKQAATKQNQAIQVGRGSSALPRRLALVRRSRPLSEARQSMPRHTVVVAAVPLFR